MNMMKSVFTFGSLTMVSRVLGFVRDMLIATFLGAGMMTDAFFMALRFPNLFRALFAEGGAAVSFVPIFSARLERKEMRQANRFASEAVSSLLYVTFLITALFEVFMPWCIMAFAPGFMGDREKFGLTVQLTRIIMPFLIFTSIESILAGMMNAKGRFAAGAAMPIILNLTMMLGIFTVRFDWPLEIVLSVCVSLAGVLQSLCMVFVVRRSGYKIKIIAPLRLIRNRSADMIDMLRRMGPTVIGSGVYHINIFMDSVFVSFMGTGAVSWLVYANRLYQLPIGMFGVAIGTVMLPALARSLSAGRDDEANFLAVSAIKFSLFVGVPSMVGLVLLSNPIVSLLFERGEFTVFETRQTSAALVMYALGLPAFIMSKSLIAGMYARGDTKTPVKIAILSLCANFIMNIIFMQIWGYVGIVLATTLSTWLAMFVNLSIMLNRRMIRLPMKLVGWILRLLASVAAMVFVILCLEKTLHVLLVIALSGTVFIAFTLWLRVVLIDEIKQLANRKTKIKA